MECARESWCDPAGGSPAQVRSSVRLVASVAWPLATVVAKRTQRLHGVWAGATKDPPAQGPRVFIRSKATCAAPLCEVLTPCRGQRPHHVQKDRIGTWEISYLAAVVAVCVRRAASGRGGGEADDARTREVGPRHSSCEADEQSEESPLRRRLRGRSQRCRWSEGRGPRGIRTSKARTGLRTRLACHRRWSVYGNLCRHTPEAGEAMGRAAEVVAPSSSIRTDGGCPGVQVNDLSRSLAAFDPISTLVVVVEMSKASWLVSSV